MTALTSLLLCLSTGVVTFLAFQDPNLRDRLLFRPDRILTHKEWYRLLASALIHADWMHLGFNLFALYSFGQALEAAWGAPVLLTTYLAAVLGGSLLSLYLHRNHADYAALGASGGVCGVLFATIFLVPGTGVGMFLLPLYIPGPVFAVLYLVATFYALRRSAGNIGHDAHFGGAIVGLLVALTVAPQSCLAAPLLFVAALVFATFCLFVLARDPLQLTGSTFAFAPTENRSARRYREYDENRARKQAQAEIDRLLDKVSAKGLHRLTPQERKILDSASAKARRE